MKIQRCCVPFLMVGLLFPFMSCGGGGSDEPFFAGTWSGTLNIIENTGPYPLAPFEATDTVNQDGDQIVILTEGGKTYQGVVTGKDSFKATRQDTLECMDDRNQPIPGCTSLFKSTIEYSALDGDNATETFTQEAGNCSCSTGPDESYRVRWQGWVTRQSNN